MASKAKPMEEIKEGVKQTEAAPEPKEEVQAKDETLELDEKDLDNLEEEKKIPYSRFREKNEEAKALKAELLDADRRYKDEILRLTSEKEALKELSSKKEEGSIFDLDEDSNNLKREIAALNSKIQSIERLNEEALTQSKIEKLTLKYPEADAMAVLGWKKVRPGEDLEDLMELSHNRNLDRVQKKYRDMLEKKKAKAKEPAPLVESGFKIKESEKPKTLKDAHSLVKRMLNLS